MNSEVWYNLTLLLVFSFMNSGIDCRVNCRDTNAGPKERSGKSCPLRCEHILTAVERLQYLDHLAEAKKSSETDSEESSESTELESRDLSENRPAMASKMQQSAENITKHILNACAEVVQNRSVLQLIHEELKYMNIFEKALSKRQCNTLDNQSLPRFLVTELFSICEKGNTTSNVFLNRIYSILNKHSNDKCFFSVALTEDLMNKIKNANLDITQPQVVPKLLKILTTTKQNTNSKITLTSRHCLSIFVSGCFCKVGYVEFGESCVTPRQCLEEKEVTEEETIDKYLHRIELV